MADIEKIVDGSPFPEAVRSRARRIFRRLFEAEAQRPRLSPAPGPPPRSRRRRRPGGRPGKLLAGRRAGYRRVLLFPAQRGTRLRPDRPRHPARPSARRRRTAEGNPRLLRLGGRGAGDPDRGRHHLHAGRGIPRVPGDHLRADRMRRRKPRDPRPSQHPARLLRRSRRFRAAEKDLRNRDDHRRFDAARSSPTFSTGRSNSGPSTPS